MRRPRLFEYHPEAILEAASAFQWYAERSPQAGVCFWEALVDARKQAERHPRMWGTFYHGARYVKLRRFPYGLVYIEREGTLIGVAVAHFKRKPGYWRERLTEQ